jgi:transposase
MPKPLTTDLSTSGPAPAGAGPEVEAKPRRRFFSAAEKLAILIEADACPHGELGALLRREGLYSSLITDWRRLRAAGQLSGLTPQKRGPKVDPHAAESARQQQTIIRLEKRLQQAEAIIDAQKKLSELFGLSQPTANSDKS